MMYYHVRYPNNLSAIQMYSAEPNSDMPQGLYAFLESYCCNSECQCTEVKIEIVKQSAMNLGYFEVSDTPIATMHYNWTMPVSDENPIFTEDVHQSEWANAGRQAFVDYVQADPHYNEELAARFLLMKVNPNPEYKTVKERHKPFERKTPKLGRNDPCFCGSGKKYKKCCIDKQLSHDA